MMPGLPVLMKSVVRNPFIVPWVAVPMMVSVVPPPTWVYIEIEPWNMAVIDPAPVIIIGAIPSTFPWTPPPTIPEKQVHFYVRNNINIVRIRDHHHFRGCMEYDKRGQRNMNANIYPRNRWNRNAK
jgi:hypothetical protein